MRRIGYMLLADEMLRRSEARGIEVRFWDDEYKETRFRLWKPYGYVDEIRKVLRSSKEGEQDG